MRKVLNVARGEYLSAIRSKAFLIGLLVMPIVIGATVFLQKVANKGKDVSDRKVVVVDMTGQLATALRTASEMRNKTSVFEKTDGNTKPIQRESKFFIEAYQIENKSRDDIRIELSEKVRSQDIFAFVIIDDGVVKPETKSRDKAGVYYHSQTPTYKTLPNWLKMVIDREAKKIRIAALDTDKAIVQRINEAQAPVPWKQLGLAEKTEEGKTVVADQESDVLRTALIPVVFMVLTFALVMTAGQMILSTVLEEKIQKISELLVSCVTPFELMLGKILGMVGLSGSLGALYIGGAGFLAYHFDVLHLVNPMMFVWLFVFLLLAIFMFGAVFAGLGAACSEMRDAQNFMTPVMLVMMAPMFMIAPIVQSPNGSFAKAVSLFPPMTPMIMLLRLGTTPGPMWWEVALSLVLTLGFTLACVWAGAKIFRIGILSQGQAPSLRKLIGWVFSK